MRSLPNARLFDFRPDEYEAGTPPGVALREVGSAEDAAHWPLIAVGLDGEPRRRGILGHNGKNAPLEDLTARARCVVGINGPDWSGGRDQAHARSLERLRDRSPCGFDVRDQESMSVRAPVASDDDAGHEIQRRIEDLAAAFFTSARMEGIVVGQAPGTATVLSDGWFVEKTLVAWCEADPHHFVNVSERRLDGATVLFGHRLREASTCGPRGDRHRPRWPRPHSQGS